MKKYKLKTIVMIISLLIVSCHVHKANRADYSQTIDQLIKDTTVRRFNGVILITRKGRVEYSKAYGFGNFNSRKPLRMSDQFEIMSNSKQITAVLILKEVDKGRIDIESPIRKYLPSITQAWADTVTVHQLLDHSHGIEDIKKPLMFRPGTEFRYGNLSYALLGQILENVTKKTYSESTDELFRSLGMKHTVSYSRDKVRNRVSGHYVNGDTINAMDSSQIIPYWSPAAGIVTTAGDLAIWNRNLHNGKLLKAETYKLMTTYRMLAEHTAFSEGRIGYGLGIRVNDKEQPYYFGHTGLGDGFVSMNLYFPESDVSLIILENQMNEKFELNYYFESEIRKLLMKELLKN